ncbi:hypothetical protein ACSBR2_015084 [Camellia fascicularis]
MLIYPLRPKPAPSELSTRGSVIPSVSTNLAEHHLTQLPAHSTGARQPSCTISAVNGHAVLHA